MGVMPLTIPAGMVTAIGAVVGLVAVGSSVDWALFGVVSSMAMVTGPSTGPLSARALVCRVWCSTWGRICI